MDAAWPIGRLTSLRQLTLSLCNPSEAPCSLPESLWQLPNLHTLELVDPHGATNHLPGNKPTAAKLQQLSINMEQLKSLPDTRGHLGDLTRLRIKHGPFEQLPAQFTQLSSLRDLELDNCMVDSLILRDGLTALERLSLETSYDHEHQHDLGLLTRFSNIQSLHIGDVSPDNIQFGAHSALTSLKISNCLEITELPASLGNLGHLRELELDANLNLGGLPEVVSRLTALTALSVSLCGSFDMQSTTILTSLRTLVLELNSGVDDDNVPVPPLGQFRLLRELFVRDGTVELTFDRLTNLTSLFLEASEIVGDVPALARLPQLRKVSCLLTSSTTNQFSSMLTGATAITDLELATSGVQSPLLPAIATLTSLRRLGLFFSHDIHHAEGWPASMTNLSQLTRLTIYSNNIPRLPEVTMLQRLRILHMPKSMMLCGPVTRLGRLECIVGGRHSPEDAEHMQAAEELVRKGVARRQG
jgi:Leucine-rich repeat (LRR) protein